MEPDNVPIDRAQLIEVCRQLSLVVVSLDRIGSAHWDEPSRLRDATGAFVTDWRVTERLAHARRVLMEALDEGLSEPESLQLDEVLQTPHWTAANPEPPPDLSPP